jgi:hypothetical protein
MKQILSSTEIRTEKKVHYGTIFETESKPLKRFS